MFDDFRAFQTAFKAFQDETNQLFIVKKSKSVDAVNKKLYNSVILLYLTILNNFILSSRDYIDRRGDWTLNQGTRETRSTAAARYSG